MDIHSVIESFAEAWVAANTQTPLTEAAASTAADAVSSGDSGSTSSGQLTFFSPCMFLVCAFLPCLFGIFVHLCFLWDPCSTKWEESA